MLSFITNIKLSRDKRLKTILYAGPGMLALALGSFLSTFIFIYFMIRRRPSSFIVLTCIGVGFLLFLAENIIMIFLLVNYLHWVITGFRIKTWEDLKNWHRKP
jgi:hypothetical protein